jgi:hypothetical protein
VSARRPLIWRPRVLAAVALLALLALGTLASGAEARRPRVGHIFVIVLENEGYAATFGNPSADPYLAQVLPSQGALLENYYATGHVSNDNYISLVSGQPPNPDTQGDCLIYSDFLETLSLEEGIATGQGCVYPASVANIGTELSTAGKKWKTYQEDMGNDPKREAAACGHPALNSQDGTQKAEPGDGYATRHDPFVYFHSVIDDQAFCNTHVVALGSPTGVMPAGALPKETGLATDLKTTTKTPKLSFITPDLCDDGHDFPCTNEPSGESALADIDAFLETWVPKILASPAYQRNGLLEIVFDEAENSDATACCEEKSGPNTTSPGITGPGGGRVGAVLLSRFIRPGTVVTTPYNHYSSLATWEDLLGVPRLGYARDVPATFGSDVFTGP